MSIRRKFEIGDCVYPTSLESRFLEKHGHHQHYKVTSYSPDNMFARINGSDEGWRQDALRIVAKPYLPEDLFTI